MRAVIPLELVVETDGLSVAGEVAQKLLLEKGFKVADAMITNDGYPKFIIEL